MKCAIALALALTTVLGACRSAPDPDPRPNILLIVADDLGYADLGAYGSDIRTPNIDALAARGVLFTQFHTAPMCAPTRAMLLSGNNNHVAGMGDQGNRYPIPGYESHLSDRIVPLPGLMRDAGYRTMTVGKWHLGLEPENGPLAAGFERAFNLLNGAGAHFSGTGFFESGSSYREDSVEFVYPDGAYSTELYTDKLISYLEPESQRPFFAFAAYTSPHWPLQVPNEYLDRYAGQFDQGYDQLRKERFQSLKAAGIVLADSELPPRNPAITPWTELSREEQRRESRKMELYAAMVENLDFHVGRLVDHLKSTGQYDNTLIVFMSDNGAAAEDFYNTSSFQSYVRAHYDNDYAAMGRQGTWVSYGPQWAEAGSAPFSRFKGYAQEGGIVAPMIASGPGVRADGSVDRAFVTVMDLAPTFLDIAATRYPNDESVRAMEGESMRPYLAGATQAVHDSTYSVTLLHRGRAFVRQGRWKLVNRKPPATEETFGLFDIEADPGETTDLSNEMPDRFAHMLSLWESERSRLGIIPRSEFPD